MYGKIVDGVLKYALNTIMLDGKNVCNPTKEQLKMAGYHQIKMSECPQGGYTPTYRLEGDIIIQEWEDPRSFSEIQSAKLTEISIACNQRINNGTQVQLSDGTSKQFSYALEDQSNISEMFTAIMVGATSYPYHADGEDCIIYSAQDIVAIYSTLTGLKTAQTTYHNQLKAYVQSLDNAQDVMAVQYGQELTGEYLEKYNQLMAVAQEQMAIILSKLTQSAEG